MERMKELIKRCKWIVKIYEAMFTFHWWFQRHYRKIKKRIQYFWYKLTIKTHFRYGDMNPDKTFFVIPFDNPLCGLYSFLLIHLPVLEYAKKKNYIPIIDFQNTFSYLTQDEDKKGKENSWEYYYEQAGGNYTLEEVYRSKNVVRYNSKVYWIDMLNTNRLCPLPEREWKRWNEILMQYARLQKPLAERVSDQKELLFPDGKKIMGVSIRAELRSGWLRGSKQYVAHPKVPSCEELIEIIDEKMQKWKYDMIFVSSDDREYLNKFISYFGDKCCHVNRRLGHWFENGQPVLEGEQRIVEYAGYPARNRTEDYIIETYLLAYCDSLYATLGSGGQISYLINGGKYENIEFYDQGIYT